MFAKGKDNSISKEVILSYVSDFDIANYYLGITSIPCIIKNPLRLDKHPSLGLFTTNGIDIVLYDFGLRKGWNIYSFLKELWCISLQEVLYKIKNEIVNFKLGNVQITQSKLINTGNTIRFSSTTEVQVRLREFRDYDLDFWNSNGISKEWLNFGDIHAIDLIFISNDKKKLIIPAEKYAYVYLEFKDNIPTIKIYQPFSEKRKWISKHDDSVWDLWRQLPEYGDILIMTKSRKDALCLWANTNIPSCSLQCETVLPKKNVVQQLKDRFKKVYILYDNDFDKEENYGRIYGQKIAEEYGLIQIEIPTELQTKDSSDLYKKYGQVVLKDTIIKLINKK